MEIHGLTAEAKVNQHTTIQTREYHLFQGISTKFQYIMLNYRTPKTIAEQ